MAFQARNRAHGSSADHIYADRSILLTVAFTDVVSSDAPRLMRSEKIKAGQKFEEILQRFEIPLLQYATRITGDRERARDVVQETFIKFQRNGSLDREDKAATWLFTVCRNGALNVCRKERRMMYLDEELIESRVGEQPMPFERLEEEEAAAFLTRIIGTLPPRQQEVLRLKFQNDLSYLQIADITKTTTNNVGVLIHTALKTLRQHYRGASKDFVPFNPKTI
jgi:RNA polymerase sigma-70 factor (ECF subfamily)